jgi:hypothetical protein
MGFLKYFVDTWSLYTVGSTTVNLSKDEAVAIAMQSIKTFSYKVGSGNETFEVKDFKVTRAMVTQLLFCSSIGSGKARGDDALMLYPMWRIGIGLDKFYPGNVYGIYVDIWADTKEVKQIQEVFSTLPPELVGSGLFDDNAAQALDSALQSNSTPILWLMFASLTLGVFGTVPVWLKMKKNRYGLMNFESFVLQGLLVFCFVSCCSQLYLRFQSR